MALQYDGLHLQTGMDSLNSSRNFLALESMKRGLYIPENVSESRVKAGKEGNLIILCTNPHKSLLNLSYVCMEHSQTSLAKGLKSVIRFEQSTQVSD